VVNVKRKGLLKGQVLSWEMTAKESLKKHRNAMKWSKIVFAEDTEKNMAVTCLLAICPPVYRRHDPTLGFITELGIPKPVGITGETVIGLGVGLSHSIVLKLYESKA